MIFNAPTTNPSFQQVVQIGILVATLGIVLFLIGLYPGITGVEPKAGIGVVQIMILLGGMSLIILGALLFIKVGFYPLIENNLSQRIAIRLCLTGLLFAAAVGLSDILGYGSNPPDGDDNFPILGYYQAGGMLVGFVMAVLGVVFFWVAGPPTHEVQQRISDARRTTDITTPVTPEMIREYEIRQATKIRAVQVDDAEGLLALQQQLDGETAFMLLGPHERQTTLEDQKQALQALLMEAEHSMIFVAEHKTALVGYISVTAGAFERNRHTAYLVMGVLQEHAKQGIGTRLLEQTEIWATQHAINRLELTVMSHNQAAVSLYTKMGFFIEGTRQRALWVDSNYVDELYMAKLLMIPE